MEQKSRKNATVGKVAERNASEEEGRRVRLPSLPQR
jgi:hypothetical protein